MIRIKRGEVPVSDAVLLTIVEVPYESRVVCRAPGCGHSVYRRVHVVRDGTDLTVLGSDCFKRLYQGITRERPLYGGGEGKPLTEAERELLQSNTAEFIERIKAEHEAVLEAQRLASQRRAVPQAPPRPPATPVRGLQPGSISSKGLIWPWMKPLASLGYFRLKDDTGWVRVLRTDEKHLLVPWPSFEGWDEALPAHIGQVDLECGGYVLRDVVEAVKYLRARGAWDKVCGSKRELDAEAARSSG